MLDIATLSKAIADFGLTAILIAFILWSGNEREKRTNQLVNESLEKVAKALDELKMEAVKGNELSRLIVAKLNGTP